MKVLVNVPTYEYICICKRFLNDSVSLNTSANLLLKCTSTTHTKTVQMNNLPMRYNYNSYTIIIIDIIQNPIEFVLTYLPVNLVFTGLSTFDIIFFIDT